MCMTKKKPLTNVRGSFVVLTYLGCGESTGQTLAQAPQSIQDASSTT